MTEKEPEKTYAAERLLMPRQFYVARQLFLRLLGFVYFLAFISLCVQVQGLIGSEGILPAGEYLPEIKKYYGGGWFLQHPTVFWISSSDTALYLGCYLGLIFSLVLMSGYMPAIACLVLWILYLSFIYIGQSFLRFQWDILLVEVGFLSIFISPWQAKLMVIREKMSRLILLLLHVVLFKLMIQSGLVKLVSEDRTWANMSALTYHYWTQPLPNPLSWYMHQLPKFFHQLSCLIMFIIELFVPCWIFLGRFWRLAAVFPLLGLQLLIMLTGNYGFFNLLTCALCILLIDDRVFKDILPDKIFVWLKPKGDYLKRPSRLHKTKSVTALLVAVFICILTVHHFAILTVGKTFFVGPLKAVSQTAQKLMISNSYGLFAVMTTERPEIIIEGSRNGRTWKTYEFKFKPGDLDKMPGQIAPYHPRLDWQMWFEALRGNANQSPWMMNFLRHLFNRSEPVMNLLKKDPFDGQPPVFLRANIYEYEFTTAAERKATGHWWKKRFKRVYVRMLVRRDIE